MGNIGKVFSDAYSRISSIFNAKPAEKSTEATQAKTINKQAEAHTFKNGEKLATSNLSQGTAKAEVNLEALEAKISNKPLSIEKQIEKWEIARDQEQDLDLGALPEQDKEVAFSVLEYAKNNGYSEKQMKNLKAFLKEVPKLYGSETILDKMGNGIRENGFTKGQLDMIANGSFSTEAYVSMVKSGKPAG